ncbi:DHS-like NAD/FAD-binding domain-containing protein [Cokeromyces recurvatus]|uniref:DHS-like NAD/FAD-binding domain-containing protein n=1 Tax=Cokeromyces recurvatus TaxID=90255 RepID=UPI00221E46B7|nr:DHS-like NAD/FAD-binding domain-containing protein [Cokeromyces recurvatus]KAI7900635.1 DHS-like NAD/FAD-binding domain-containing protein [Cokeromyces recurvatus]
MSGAGISTAAGIPDFRSKGTGLYHNLQKFNLPYAEAVFDIEYFLERPEPFYALAKELYPGRFLPTKTHYFIRLLQEKGILLRNFTQNIDTLERMTGLDPTYIIEAHGSFATASCVECKRRADPEMVKKAALKGQVPRCIDCDQLVKPDITFFGENLPKRFFHHLQDFERADLLIILGTSLQVQPFASLIEEVPEHVPRLLINKELAGVHSKSRTSGFDFEWKNGLNRDVAYLGSCDDGVKKLAELLGWEKELERLYTKGNEKLKAVWKAEEEEKEEKTKATEEEVIVDQKKDPEVEQLAEELEQKLTTLQKEDSCQEQKETAEEKEDKDEKKK